DEAVEHGVDIDVERLEEKLGVPVVPTCALSGEGIKDLRDRMDEARPGQMDFTEEERWHVLGNIVESVQTVRHRHPTVGEKLSHATVHPLWGPILAVFILAASFEFVRLLGEGLIGYVFEPLFVHLWLPVLNEASALLGGEGLLHDILIGKLIGGGIDFEQSFGLLSTGLYIPFAAVLPYIIAFYLALSLLEDIGYLPRLGVLVDNVMHRIGLHGLSIIPMMLGLGCNVPGALATRVLETRKERFIASTLMAVCRAWLR
ncbi:MAG: nucleoside recognition domain-containing protein, partial [Planctomycetota bacterium]